MIERPLAYCREEVPWEVSEEVPWDLYEPENDYCCNRPAEFILWGKLLPKEALGPRCYDHAAKHVGLRALTPNSSWALFDLRQVRRKTND